MAAPIGYSSLNECAPCGSEYLPPHPGTRPWFFGLSPAPKSRHWLKLRKREER